MPQQLFGCLSLRVQERWDCSFGEVIGRTLKIVSFAIDRRRDRSESSDMGKPSIELHCHTMFSPDGVGTPEQLVDVAAANGVQRLAITDHHSVAAYERGMARARQHGIMYHVGVEINASWQDGVYDFLAYDFDPHDETLLAILERSFSVYEGRFRVLHPLLKEAFPWVPEIEELRAFAAQKEPTHPSPIVSSYQFRSWLRENDPGFFNDPARAGDQKRFRTLGRLASERYAAQGIKWPAYVDVRDAVHNAGGIILLAHIGQSGGLAGETKEKKIEFLNNLLANGGLDGFELYHPSHRDDIELNREHPFLDDLRAFGEKWDCVMSGGSDCHNCLEPRPDRIIGSCGASVDLFDPAKALSRR